MKIYYTKLRIVVKPIVLCISPYFFALFPKPSKYKTIFKYIRIKYILIDYTLFSGIDKTGDNDPVLNILS